MAGAEVVDIPEFCGQGRNLHGPVALFDCDISGLGLAPAGFEGKATPKNYHFKAVLSVRWYNSIRDGTCHP
jgi:hypothetical protein